MSIEILPSAADVIALRIQGKLDHAGMERMIGMIESSISEHGKTHFFVEAIDFRGSEFRRLGDYAGRAWPNQATTTPPALGLISFPIG